MIDAIMSGVKNYDINVVHMNDYSILTRLLKSLFLMKLHIECGKSIFITIENWRCDNVYNLVIYINQAIKFHFIMVL